MPHLVWTNDLNTGIDVIDSQHRQIVNYINQLHDNQQTYDRTVVAAIIDAMIDYTVSHFGFEETLMEDAGYEFVRPHKRVHELFIKRIDDLKTRFSKGEDILEELLSLLTRWLLNHIKHDDAGYISSVKPALQGRFREDEGAQSGWLGRTISRFFRT